MVGVGDATRQYLQYLVVERGLSGNTVESYQRDLRRYAEVLAARGKSELAGVTAADVAEFRAALRAGDEEHPPLAASSVGRAIVAVRGLHGFAFKQGLAGDDPAREVAPPQALPDSHLRIAAGEKQRCIRNAAAGDRDVQDRAGVIFRAQFFFILVIAP